MNKTMNLICAALILIFAAAVEVHSDAKTSPPARRLTPAQGPNDLGLIFSTGDLLMGLESYQAGLGAKIGWGNVCVRGAFDFLVNGASNSFSVEGGATGEYHLGPGPISPYVGAYAQVGYMRQGSTTSAIPISLGPVIGVEVFVLDFLSLFVEYSVAVDLTVTTDLLTSQTTFDYLIDTRMGNNSKLGLVIYLMRMGAKK